ncbi:rod shape-determining protein MreC [Paraferrimonas sp. SM1919]|uniref:rod shape-determining protein MreC n=1 Tax=Paraferrimonas sp. SM1919 TaxID=2662263 RepID=UPI0013D832AA|nr:rod shape-determining protein MreC [Paraferrimonas sp. SM1919]
MKPIFADGVSIQARLVIAVLLSLMLFGGKQKIEPLRQSLATLLSPLQFVANLPSYALDWIDESLAAREHLLKKNAQLLQQQLEISERLQRFEHLNQENARLRALLGSRVHFDAKKMVTEVISVASDPYQHFVTIPLGLSQGVYDGQPVIDNKGVIGQVIQVNQLTAKVLLISDHRHGIPVRVSRNDVRSIAVGSGDLDQLVLNYLPNNTDIKEGDLLVSSGLGGRFPEGYPVARVKLVERSEQQRYAKVIAEPVAALSRLRYLLLLWPEGKTQIGVTDGD